VFEIQVKPKLKTCCLKGTEMVFDMETSYFATLDGQTLVKAFVSMHQPIIHKNSCLTVLPFPESSARFSTNRRALTLVTGKPKGGYNPENDNINANRLFNSNPEIYNEN
jgi:hypothetical protein